MSSFLVDDALFSVQKIGTDVYEFTLKAVVTLPTKSVSLLISSLKLICTQPHNVVLFDCTRMKSAKLQKQFFDLNFSELISINKKGFKKFIIVSKSTVVLVSTKLLSKLMGTSHIVFTCKSREEGLAIAAK